MNKNIELGVLSRAVTDHGTAKAAAAAMGMPRSTFHAALHRERAALAQPTADLATLSATLAALQAQVAALTAPVPATAAVADKPRVRVQAGSDRARPAGEQNMNTSRFEPEFFSPLGDNGPYVGKVFGVEGERAPLILAPPSRKGLRVLVIGDTHFHPGIIDRTRRCMALVGFYAASKASALTHVVHIGDGSDWASVCRHTRNDTWKARQKPSVAQDLSCFRSNWDALNGPMDAAGVTRARHYTMGNHDAWLECFEDATPEVKGIATSDRDRTLTDAGWTHSSYGAFAFVGGVAFTHVPLNLMGKPVGGASPENGVALQSTHDVVFGHTHRANQCRRVKAGLGNAVTALNVGGTMPEFYVGDYAQLSMGSAVTSGISDLFISEGRIQGSRTIPMRELEELHGAQADAFLLNGRA